MAKFNDQYIAVFNAVKAALVYVPGKGDVSEKGCKSIRTVLLGEQFSLGGLPKAVINALPSPVAPSTFAKQFELQINFSVILTIQTFEPKDWFVDVIPKMGDVVDALLADPTLGGVCRFVELTSFAPGEIKFQGKMLYGGSIGFRVHKKFLVT